MFRILLIATIGIFSTPWASAQGTEQEIEEVIVRSDAVSENVQLRLDQKRIENKLATDVGQLLILFPGMQLKSYGGVGGMKTASFRSLGAGHTSVVLDYQTLSTTQGGATDLGLIPSDFVLSIDLVQQASTSPLLPIHSKLAGSILSIQTKHLDQSERKEQFSIGFQTGSFGLYEGLIFTAKKWKKWSISASGKGRRIEGTYPFSYKNGTTLIKTQRENSDVSDVYGTFTAQYAPSNKHTFYVQTNVNYYDKGLPGAVIFYNETADQRLNGNQFDGNLRHLFQTKRFQWHTTCSYQQQYLRYLDSSYLNAAGFLDNRFFSQQWEAQSQVRITIARRAQLLFGSSIRNEQLTAASLTQDPNRITSESLIGFSYSRFGKLSAQLGFMAVNENTRQTFQWLPSADWSYSFNNKLLLGFSLRHSMRLPTFSELYYQQIGNNQLQPEQANLASLRLSRNFQTKHWSAQTLLQPYFAHVTNKIIAIPTKNLFIWSILNIGKTAAYGTECTEQIRYSLPKGMLGLNINYTFQYAIDITDKNTETYRHIISYSPLHSGSAELSYTKGNWSIFSLLTYQGQRYALNENIDANLLDAFWLLDLGASMRWKWKKNTFSTRLNINNVTNNYYSYIRYFIMPGIHFNLKLSYAF